MLSQFSCPAKYFLRVKKGYVPIRGKPALSFGGVIHHGMAAWYRTGDPGAALKAIHDHWPEVMPSDDFRTQAYALKVMAAYIKEHPKETWEILQTSEGPVVEKAFTLPTGRYLECPDCEGYMRPKDGHEGQCSGCGRDLELIEYGGIIDLGISFANMLYVVDHKTTTKLGQKDSTYYFMAYKPDNQMTGYIWGLSKITNRKVGGAIINALGLYKSGTTLFKRQITTRNNFELDEWLDGVVAKCNAIRRCERTGHWRLETDQCTVYGLCEYHSVHILNDPVAREKRLEQDYVISRWDYEERDD